ncbi:MAG: sulfurtransferase TusA family protein [Synechococcales cyanobacterium]
MPTAMSDLRLDLRGIPCPLNLVRSRLYLQKLPPGTCLEIWLDQGDPLTQVPSGLETAGHRIQAIQYPDPDTAIVQVERGL